MLIKEVIKQLLALMEYMPDAKVVLGLHTGQVFDIENIVIVDDVVAIGATEDEEH